MSKLELFHAYHIIMAKWKVHQPNDLRVNTLVPLPISFLKIDDSLSYFEDSVLDLWKLQFKHLSKAISKEQDLEILDTYRLRDQAEEAVYEPNIVPLRDYSIDIEGARARLGSNPSVDDLFRYIATAFTPNWKQSLIIRNVLKAILKLDTSQFTIVIESSQQFLLYIRGYRGTRKSQVINVILFAMELLGLGDRPCVTASTSIAAVHIKGQTIHSALGITA